MRIDQLHIQNFRKFADLTIDLHPKFTLLVGSNGSGKTTILDALAVSLGVWLANLPAIGRHFPHRTIQPTDPRLVPEKVADQVLFQEQKPVAVTAIGKIGDGEGFEWKQTFTAYAQLDAENAGKKILQIIDTIPQSDCPILAFYGVTRAALPDPSGSQSMIPAQRWDAYLNCLNASIDYNELRRWFYREAAAAGANGGHKRLGFEVVRRAVFGCVPDADDLWFDVDRADLVCSIGGQAQPLSNLSDGQRMLLAMVADIAIKAVTLNAHLLDSNDELLVLKQTPGVVLIDELDLHLHPSWQRRVAADLKRTFPSIQFVCTSHSPQIIGEVPPEQIRIIDGDVVYSPEYSFGVDSSRILEEIMDTKPRTAKVDDLLTKLARQIGDDDFNGAHVTIQEAAENLGENDPEIIRARTLMAFVEHKA